MSSTEEQSEPRPGASVFAGEEGEAPPTEPTPAVEGPGDPARPAADPARAAAEPTRPSIEVTCPGCGTISRFEEVRREADAFCRRCDYPLFWARGAITALDPGEGGEGLRRLPGTAGRLAEAAISCRVCREPNRPSAVICIRCGAELAPPPEPEPAPPPPPPAPAPPPPPEPEPEPASRWWLWLTIAAVVGLVLLLWLLSLD